ncbi:MAG: hypothetical protein B7Z73_06175 [Planctomycetia bacterium 21-64-5]|nr:MAG: hypothetical protein B7Z73_06175 [Planctomycetia bacterium 21-64-5]HQU41201.1 hypothetical protein [Pirellulales bacterium]
MFEAWLLPNRRILAFAAILPAAALVTGIALVAASRSGPGRGWLLVPGAIVSGVSLVGLLFLFWQSRQARLACDGRRLLVQLGTLRPVAVPLEVVEGFLLGQGPSFLPGKRYEAAQVANFVVRLAERASEWERVEVNRQLGTWCGHYITICGTWCQPLSVALVNRLNARLTEVKQSLPREAAR